MNIICFTKKSQMFNLSITVTLSWAEFCLDSYYSIGVFCVGLNSCSLPFMLKFVNLRLQRGIAYTFSVFMSSNNILCIIIFYIILNFPVWGWELLNIQKLDLAFTMLFSLVSFFFWFVSVEIVAFYSSQLIRNILRSKFELNYVDGENIGKLI